MGRLAVCFLLCLAAAAQTLVDPARLPGRLRTLEPRPGDEALHCEVNPLEPALNFGFRFQSGYVARVPLSQYVGSSHRLAVLTRITPDLPDAQPVYLLQTVRLPPIPHTGLHGEIGGGYLLGAGRYNITWMLLDDAHRYCRKEWHVDAQLTRSESKVRPAMPPHTISDFSPHASSWSKHEPDDARPLRLTVLLDASPLIPRHTKLHVADRMMLIGSLAALLERVPARSVRVVVFNLDQQKEIFRQDDFSTQNLDQVAQSMNDLELGLVDYHVLQNRRGHVDLLLKLVDQELTAKEPSDAVVFLGPTARYADKLPKTALVRPASAPRFFYFQFKPLLRRAPANFPDSIQSAVERLKGRNLLIHSPGEFAKAIDALESSGAK